MSKVFVIDVSHCNGCYCCQLACKDEHCGNDWSPYAKPQPDTGQFWMRLEEHVRGTIPKVKIHYIPHLCNHCENAACIETCTKHLAIRRREDGLVVIDSEKCVGCRRCVEACPYGAIFYNEELKLAQKCTGCAHLLDAREELPRCVQACTMECIKFGEKDEFAEILKEAVVMKPEANTGPRVYYTGIPGRFIAGTVYDPVRKEILEGATVELRGAFGAKSVTTNGFGDFWFMALPENETYDVTIRHTGFADKTFLKLCTDRDHNLGDIPLS